MLSPNTVLQSRYRVVRELGHGGMGTVYEAVDQRVNCLVALKETTATLNIEARAAFEREAALLANLRHQCLPKVMDFFSDGDSAFLVMEFIPGQDLAQLLVSRGTAFPQEQVLQWANDLLRLLQYLHEQEPPILHRDIKPSNLKLTGEGELFLLDFGLAKGSVGQMPTMMTSRSVFGYTPIYASLEQIHGQGTDARSDIYSVGATLYHLLAGVPPIAATVRYDAIADDKPDPLSSVDHLNPNVSRSVAQVIQLAMAIVRKERFVSATVMGKALHSAAKVDSREAPRKQVQSETIKLETREIETKAKDGGETAALIVPLEPTERHGSPTSLSTIAAFDPAIDIPRSTTASNVSKHEGRRRRGFKVALVTVAIAVFVAMLVIGPTAIYFINKAAKRRISQGGPNAPSNLQSFEFSTLTMDNNQKVLTREKKTGYSYAEDLGNNVKLEMVAIPPGEFTMGSPDWENGRDKDEGPQHRVRIAYWFYIGKFEVTQAQWRSIMGTNPSYFKDCDDCPVEQVSWNDAVEFCNRLSTRTGTRYRLPAESEWEYAARAGSASAYAFGQNTTSDVANYDPSGYIQPGINRRKTIPVGSLSVANGFGLYDIQGNVAEWCTDWYHAAYDSDAPSDGSAWVTDNEMNSRILRGGSWWNFAWQTRVADRTFHKPDAATKYYGFRVVVVR